MDVLRVAAASRAGRHYTDMRSALLDARRSAAAVRELLEEGLAGVTTG